MAESLIQVSEGAGKKIHSFSQTVGANTVEDQFAIPAEYPYASYSVVAPNVSLATSASHLVTLNAGASLKVRIRKITIEQAGSATAAGSIRISIRRITTAEAAGTAITPSPFDPSDAASGATAKTLPTAGAEGAVLGTAYLTLRQAVSATGSAADDPAYVWQQLPNQKPIIIAAGTTNGIALVAGTGVAGATADITIEFVETSY